MKNTVIKIKTTLPRIEVEQEVQELWKQERFSNMEFSIKKITNRLSMEQLGLTIIGAVAGALIKPLVERLLKKIIDPNPSITSINVVHIHEYKRIEFVLPRDMDSFVQHFEAFTRNNMK